jgi:hypothetical protein
MGEQVTATILPTPWPVSTSRGDGLALVLFASATGEPSLLIEHRGDKTFTVEKLDAVTSRSIFVESGDS